jgi:hypothetical protein
MPLFLLHERLTYDRLFRISDPKRVTRSLSVRGPPLEIDSYQDAVYYAFNFKANPSTTGLRHRGYIKFFKPKNGRETPLQYLECLVDCTCPDFRYRWAWANKQRGSSRVGAGSLNQAWNRAPRKTNPSGKPGLCKHILAAREYIYSLLSSFPSDKPDTAEKLDKLTRFATRRWTDFEGQVGAAREREAQIQQQRQLRNVVGRLPDEPPPERPPAVAGREEEPERRATTAPYAGEVPVPLPPPEPAGEPAEPASAFAAVKPPGERGRKLPVRPKPYGPYGGYETPVEREFNRRRGLGDALERQSGNYLAERVVNANGERELMTTLNDAIKLVEEMVDDEAAIGQHEPLEPSEPPVSDSAIGADTEGDTAFELLRQMRDSLQQIAAVVAPEETPEEAAAEGAEAEAGAEEDLSVPPPDEETAEELQDEEEIPESSPNRRPVAK